MKQTFEGLGRDHRNVSATRRPVRTPATRDAHESELQGFSPATRLPGCERISRVPDTFLHPGEERRAFRVPTRPAAARTGRCPFLSATALICQAP